MRGSNGCGVTRVRTVAAMLGVALAAAMLLLGAVDVGVASCMEVLRGGGIPERAYWQVEDVACDLDGDGVVESRVVVDEQHGARVLACDAEVFASPDEWRVFDAFAYDIDADGADELVFLVWKRGSFGNYRPFWKQGADDAWSQHVFVYGARAGQVVSLWMSSALGQDVASAEVRGDGALELTSPDGETAAWCWGSWGFVLEDADDEAGAADGPAGRKVYVPTYAQAQEPGAGPDGGVPDGPGWAAAMHDGGVAIAPRSLASEADSASVASGAGGVDDATAMSAEPKSAAEVQRVSLLVAGDNIAYQGIYEAAYDSESREFDFSGVYGPLSAYVSGFDVAAVCQETVLVADAAKRSGYPEFATPAAMADALAAAGFDVVASASNHVNDRGAGAIRETLEYWENGHPEVAVAGLHEDAAQAGAPCMVERGGIRLAFFNLTYGLNGHALPEGEEYLVDTLEDDKAAVFEGIRALRDDRAGRAATAALDGQPQADLVILMLHMGEEYASEPTEEQRRLVEEAIDAGADLVLCSHSHVVAPYGEVTTRAGNTGLVYWGFGNFVASQGNLACQVGGLATLDIEKATAPDGTAVTRIASFDLVPSVCHVDKDGSAQVFLLGDYTDELASRHVLSDPDDPLTAADFRQAFEGGTGL